MNDPLQSTDKMPPATKSINLFAQDSSGFDWGNYLKSRPDYTGSALYDRLFAYHDSHSGSYNTAYDVGCGPGQVASALAAKFSRVHGSDPNTYIISQAIETFKGLENVSFEIGTAENIVSADESRLGTADMITVAECIPLLDLDAAMSAFARLLRPGGTLAIWFYGSPVLTSPGLSEDSPKVKGVQTLFQDILDRTFEEFRPFKGGVFERPCTMINSWLDNVPFDPAQFKDVKRVKWNTDRELNMISRAGLGFDIKHIDLIGESEVVVDEGVDRTLFLKEGVDLAWAKGFMDSVVVRKKEWMTEELEEMLGHLGDKMEGYTWNAAWPAALLLATKT